jgi:hypothetical protein
MTMAKRGAAVLALGALGTAAVLAGAGPAGASRAHTTAATSPTSAELSFSATLSGAQTAPITVTGTGQLDFVHDQASGTATLPGGLGLGGGPVTAQLVASGNTLYAMAPGLSTLLGGTPWVSISGSAARAAKVPTAYTDLAAAFADPAAVVAKAQADGATTKSLGTRTENGQQQTGTEVDVNVAKALSGISGLSAAERQAAQGTTITFDVWSDSSGRLAVLSTDVATTSSGSATATVTVTSYDDPVSITVPSPSQTHALTAGSLSELLPLIENALGVNPTTTNVLETLGTHFVSTTGHPATHHKHR